MDACGYLYLMDRQSSLIISGAVNIYPQETENVLITHPAVADVFVESLPRHPNGKLLKRELRATYWPADNRI